MTFRELVESKGVTIGVSKLQGAYSGETGLDDFDEFIDSLKQHGMKDKDWVYDGETNIIIPAKFERFTKAWRVKKLK